jgi:hypothetical protein
VSFGGAARWLLGGVLGAALVALAWFGVPQLRDPAFWREQASPGPLTAGHAFLAGRCDACHVALESVPAAQCIACHADAKDLLQRQPTAFHATVGACAECHKEHQGPERMRARMDHETLARLGLARLALAPAYPRSLSPTLSPLESLLDCSNCHATKDRHGGLFGSDCGACHATPKWTLADFRHPSPALRECAQCHQAPPSHYMEHFTMVSRRVARQPGAQVRECFLCHRTTSWNDIAGVGYYKHH